MREELLRRYEEPERFYHGVEHVRAMLELLAEYEPELRRPDIVREAIWYHDAVYDSRRQDNEERSAELARAELEAGLAADVSALILATKRHALDGVPEDLAHDAGWFLDFDLAILGHEAEEYDDYAAAIRREYAWVPDDEYRAGRARVLRWFLERPALYFNAEFRARFELAARQNLARELRRLEG